jgi:hypothetical protein
MNLGRLANRERDIGAEGGKGSHHRRASTAKPTEIQDRAEVVRHRVRIHFSWLTGRLDGRAYDNCSSEQKSCHQAAIHHGQSME